MNSILEELKQTFLNVRHRSLVVASALTFLFISVISAYSSYTAYSQRIRESKADISNLIFAVETELRAHFNYIDLMLKHIQDELASKGSDKKWTAKEYQELLAYEKKLVPEMFALKVIDEHGRYIGDADGVITDANLSDRNYFQAHKNNPDLGLHVSEPVISKSTGELVIVLSRRIPDENKLFKGIIIATVRPLTLSQFFNDLKLNQNDDMGIINLSKNMLVVTNNLVDKKIGDPVDVPSEMMQVLQNSKGLVLFEAQSPYDQIYRSYGLKILTDLNVYIFVGLPISDILSDWNQQFYFGLIFIFFITIGLIAFMYTYLKNLNSIEEQRLNSVNSLKLASLAEMASGVAHEINNPITIIQAYARQVKNDLKNENIENEKINEKLTKISDTASRIANIVKGLRAFSREDDKSMMEEVPLSKIIESSLDLCRERFRLNEVELRVEDIPGVTILCRQVQLVQVIINLLNNSYDAVQELDEKWVDLSFVLSKDKYLHILVTDSGRGIPGDVIDKLMQPFFTTKGAGKGTGLGLSVSKGIIEDHRGTLVYNKSSLHTQFKISLPIAKII